MGEVADRTGKRTEYRGAQLAKIGMPIGGICAGGLYLGGDGRLWLWDIFNANHFGISPQDATYEGQKLNAGGGSAYVSPPDQVLPFDQGFGIAINDEPVRQHDIRGFKDIRFIGEYPVGTIRYLDHPTVVVELEAFSPFIPLDAKDSSLPATLMHYKVRNTGAKPVNVTMHGWMENPLGHNRDRHDAFRLTNQTQSEANVVMATMGIESIPQPASTRFELPFESWDSDTYVGWTVEGTAFGTGPILKSKLPDYQGDVGGPGDRVVNSHATAAGSGITDKDGAVGKLISKSFQLERNFLQFWIGGGKHAGTTCLNLLVDGKVVRTATGADNNKMRLESFSVKEFAGKAATIEIVDAEKGAWGNIGVGRIWQTDTAPSSGPLETMADYGTLAIAVLGDGQQLPLIDRRTSMASLKP